MNEDKPCVACRDARNGCSPKFGPAIGALYNQGFCQLCAILEFTKRGDQSIRLHRIIGRHMFPVNETYPGFDSERFAEVREFTFNNEERCDDRINLVIEGPPGVGKTRMAALLCDRLVTDRRLCEWTTESEFFATVGELGHTSERKGAESWLNAMSEVDYLFFDDLGSSSLTDARWSRLCQLIDHRYRNNSPTVFTTNWSAKMLARRIERQLVGLGMTEEEAATDAHRLLRRIYGSRETPLARIVSCRSPVPQPGFQSAIRRD